MTLRCDILAYFAALNCPNCGAPLRKETMKCEYCGSELVLLQDGSSFRLKNESTCPKCGATNEKSSWFCLNCNTILTKNTEMLRILQKKLRFVQDQMKQDFLKKVPSSLIRTVDTGEYFYSTLSREQGANLYGITNKRLIKYKDGNYKEISLSEIVDIYPPRAKVETSVLTYVAPLLSKPQVKLEFEVSTYQGIVKFDGIAGNPMYCGLFMGFIRQALLDYQNGKRAVGHVLLDLPLEEK